MIEDLGRNLDENVFNWYENGHYWSLTRDGEYGDKGPELWVESLEVEYARAYEYFGEMTFDEMVIAVKEKGNIGCEWNIDAMWDSVWSGMP